MKSGTDTAAAVTIYKDNNAPFPFGATADQFVTAVNTTPYQISYSKTNTANNTIHPRVDFFARILDPTIANFDCHSFIITMTTDPAVVGANNTFTYNSWSAFYVRYQATRQFRVQD